MIKKLQDLEVENKKVLLRVDFNVPFSSSGEILDDTRILAVKPTLDYLIQKGCSVILLTHFSKAAGLHGETVFNLEKFAKAVGEILSHSIGSVHDVVGDLARQAARNLASGEILLLDNLRNDPGEKQNGNLFASKLASLGQVYINDAFGVCHRSHASVVSLPRLLPSGAGLLLQREMEMLQKSLQESRELTVIVGGAKISTKINFISRFLNKAQNVLVGGALANNLLKQKGLAVGQSLIEENIDQEKLKQIDLTTQKLHLPLDAVVAVNPQGKDKRETAIGQVKQDEIILDIGPETQKLFGSVIKESRVIIWNGPMGFFEKDEFFAGTRAVIKAIATSNAFSVVGGGETILCIKRSGLAGYFSHISTGGGAMMEFLLNPDLPGIMALRV